MVQATHFATVWFFGQQNCVLYGSWGCFKSKLRAAALVTTEDSQKARTLSAFETACLDQGGRLNMFKSTPFLEAQKNMLNMAPSGKGHGTAGIFSSIDTANMQSVGGPDLHWSLLAALCMET